MANIAQIFKALGDETRLKILIILASRRICAKGIAKHLAISDAAVSQHLKVLKEAGIIVGEKIGYYVHYNVQDKTFIEIIEFINKLNNDDFEINTCKLGVKIPKKCEVECKATRIKLSSLLLTIQYITHAAKCTVRGSIWTLHN
ncbi:ArsR family transcriptional regulator [Desulfitispora alkaliphila]|uniref:ArsR/SmtB family transcription factor n=1 Tax=Desulfitispora alkaliphila TaxID=622674 RepID=UPI003D23E1F9